MKVKNKINFSRIEKNLKNTFKKKLEKYIEVLKIKIDEKTPENTKELIGNTKVSEIVEYRNKFFVKIYNDTEYAVYVEYGVGKVFNYHKNKIVFYSGDGAGFFSRSVKEVEGKFEELTRF